MKDFKKLVAANLTAMSIAWVVPTLAILTLLVVVVLVSGPPAPAVPEGAVLTIDLNTNIADGPPRTVPGDVWGTLLGGETSDYTLAELIYGLEKAAADPKIEAVLLRGNLLSLGGGSSYAALREVRSALMEFRNAGKKVYAYLEGPTMRDYYLASVADEVVLHPMGVVAFPGLAVEGVYLGETLRRYGIGVQVTRVGEYKSAVEPFIGTQMSPADREQLGAFIERVWQDVLADVAQSRKMSEVGLRQLSDQRGYFDAEEALAGGLVDRVEDIGAFVGRLRARYPNTDEPGSFQQVDFRTFLPLGTHLPEADNDAPVIAIVYAQGAIVPGEGQVEDIGADWLARELRKLRLDEDVAAVVLRVNSPGGSAFAAETIRMEAARLAEDKPLVVSMGAMAASGGYWIACPAQVVLAQPTTLTGSIGVFGLLFNIEGLASDHGVAFDGVKTSPFADFETISRPRRPEEMARIQEWVDDIYADFLTHVSEGRGLNRLQVQELAQGRIWSGRDAVERGLADRTGGLQAALVEAARLIGAEDYQLREVPRSRDFSEVLLEALAESEDVPPLAASLEPVRLPESWERLRKEWESWQTQADPLGIYVRLPYMLQW